MPGGGTAEQRVNGRRDLGKMHIEVKPGKRNQRKMCIRDSLITLEDEFSRSAVEGVEPFYTKA